MARRALAVLLALVAWLLLWPVDLRPVAWTPPVPRDLGPAAPLLARRLETPGHTGPEDVAIDAAGALYAGTSDGTILRWAAPDAPPVPWAHTGGRPLGLDFAPDGRLIVADGVRGLLAVTPDGAVTVLADTVASKPVRFVDDVEVSDGGVAWFSDASDRFGYREWKTDLVESAPNGRLCSVDLATGDAREVWTGLHFANGVAVGPDDAFVLVVETARYRVQRLWLTGPRAGEREVFLDALPAFPDGISSDGDRFWLALASPRNPVLDALAPYPFLRTAIARLPAALQPAPALHAWLLGLDVDGRVVAHLHTPAPAPFGVVTSVQRHGSFLHLGSLHEAAIARVAVP